MTLLHNKIEKLLANKCDSYYYLIPKHCYQFEKLGMNMEKILNTDEQLWH